MLCDPRPQCSVQWPSVDLVHWLWFILASCKHLLQKTLQWQVSFFLPYWKQCSKSCRSDCSCHLQGEWSGGQTLSAVLQKTQRLWEPWVCLHMVSKLHQFRPPAAFPKSRANPNHKKRVHPKLGLLHWQEDTALSFLPSRFLPPTSPILQNTFTEQLKASFF